MKLSDKLKGVTVPGPSTEPLWKGPVEDGITQSLLSRYLACKERFRLLVIEGLKPVEGFSQRMEYGNMWHVCEEAHATLRNTNPAANPPWLKPLIAYCRDLADKYPLQGQQVDHWYNVCKVQFPIYVDWWKRHPDVRKRIPLLEEKPFRVSYPLPDDRSVTLLGKWDSIDYVEKSGIWIQENKSKGDIDESLMQRQLKFDLQTMIYEIALMHSVEDSREIAKKLPKKADGKIRGVRYNVIRRPLSGGKGSIRQKKNQTTEEYYEELSEIIRGAVGPEWGMPPGEHFFFMRWNVEVSDSDVNKFQRQTFDPVVENLLDDYEWWAWCYRNEIDHFDYRRRELEFPHHLSRHYRLPFGIYNPLMEGKASELDEYLDSGSETGLQRTDDLFPELKV